MLDVATGTGAVLLAVADWLGGTGRLTGIDASAAMLARAVDAVRGRALRGVELRLMDAHELNFADNSFDYVLCSFAFLAFQDKGRILEQFARVLAPGGSVCLLDAYGWFFQHDPRWTGLEELLRSFEARPERASSPFGPGYLEAALKTGGFDVLATAERVCDLLFRDDKELWRWMWSHGTRSLLEAVPPDRLTALRQAMPTRLAACRTENDTIQGTLRSTLAKGQLKR